jgi:hypothetical protein
MLKNEKFIGFYALIGVILSFVNTHQQVNDIHSIIYQSLHSGDILGYFSAGFFWIMQTILFINFWPIIFIGYLVSLI